MGTRQEEVLRATAAAATVFQRFPLGRRTSFDIVGAIVELGIPLLFRPLSALWGASVMVGPHIQGVLVTTKLALAVQRFTLAHELGHILLGHETRLDETVSFAGRFAATSRPKEELAADIFASELLAPRALMLSASRRHRWTRTALMEPTNVYQLSLRLGISFQAACWALAAHKVIPQRSAEVLQKHKVKSLKVALAPESLIENAWADVWKLTDGDTDSFIEAVPDDIFAVHLEDNASAGYLWELVDPGPDSEVLDERILETPSYGASTARALLLRFRSPGTHRLVFMHRRPWNQETIANIDIAIDNHGKEMGGLARRHRARALAAVGA
jgi:Zn-dependent peptidase ImmA (M78 family)/predicted secreted protein